MSEFHIKVVRVGSILKHPNADTLSITNIHGGYPVIFRTGDFQEGDLAVYIPIDSVLPNEPRWDFLAGHLRIRAKKLRSIFSMGMLTTADPTWEEGQDVISELGITKYEPPVQNSFFQGSTRQTEPNPEGWIFQKYTDIEGYRRWPDILQEGEEVIITEKLHGCNTRYCHDGSKLWIGSHNIIKSRDGNEWEKVALQENFEERLAKAPGYIFYGEIYGKVQDLCYNIDSGSTFRCFDILDTKTNLYLNYFEARELADSLEIPLVPVLYAGPWSKKFTQFSKHYFKWIYKYGVKPALKLYYGK